MGTKITNVEYYLPEKIVSNEELSALGLDWDANKIETKIGIKQRHVVKENETALDIAYLACEKLFEKFDKSKIDFIILCTQSPDYYLPTSACILQNRLGLNTSVGAFDFNLGCSGYVYGLAIAKGLINAGICKTLLFVTSETYSKYLNVTDISNRSIFGDAATATIIEYSNEEKIFEFSLGTDGKGKDNLIVEQGGSRNPLTDKTKPGANVELLDSKYLYMNGPEIFNFTIEAVPPLINDNLIKNGESIDSLDFFIFHQANKYMLDYLRKKSKIPVEKFYSNMLLTGNTVSSTIPIALRDSLDSSIIKVGDKVLLCGFGVGYSWGATIVEI